MGQQVKIDELMQQSGVGFGTSGARGLVSDMTDLVCYAYTRAFLQHLFQSGALAEGSSVAVAGDFRPSSPRIMAACMQAIRDAGCQPINCGEVPTPAVALFGMARSIPSLMVTGSHIPDDRNGIKFNKAEGEILKTDEAAIRQQSVEIPENVFTAEGMAVRAFTAEPVETAAYAEYVRRYVDFFPAHCMAGKRIGVYEHSSVARDAMGEVLATLGAEVVPLGRSEHFIPVDTEAVRPEDVALAERWGHELHLDAIISADGDGDRPLISDEHGQWLRGDVAGILCAHYLGATHVVTPVSSNSAIEKCGWFARVARTRIGSPFVIEAMQAAMADAGASVVGYEANGGFLIATDIHLQGNTLKALPTRDAIIVPLAILMLASAQQTTVAGLQDILPKRYTYSDRLKAFPTEISRARIAALGDTAAIEAVFGELFGRVASTDNTDGLRITFISDEVVHLRPSGNAPELRCYNEASSPERAAEMNRQCLSLMEGWRQH